MALSTKCPCGRSGFCNKHSRYSLAVMLDHKAPDNLKHNGYMPKMYCYMSLNKKPYQYNRQKLIELYNNHKTELHPYAHQLRFYDNATGALLEIKDDLPHPYNLTAAIGNIK